jgi:hypothetical protein
MEGEAKVRVVRDSRAAFTAWFYNISCYLCGIFPFNDLRCEQVMASMRLFAQEVMPALSRYAG